MARFLVVDDDGPTARAMARLLGGDGHEVSTFTTGADAVAALSHGHYDAVMTDLEMPHVDGHAVVRAAREHQPHACVVVTSGRAEAAFDRMVAAGACMIADKPLQYDRLTREMAACHARRQSGEHGQCRMRSGPPHRRYFPMVGT